MLCRATDDEDISSQPATIHHNDAEADAVQIDDVNSNSETDMLEHDGVSVKQDECPSSSVDAPDCSDNSSDDFVDKKRRSELFTDSICNTTAITRPPAINVTTNGRDYIQRVV